MPQVNLTAVSGQELRQLLDSSRRRGDAALSYRILQEMAARRDAPAERRAFKGRGPAEPRLVAVEFGDPLEKEDLPPMPNWRPPGPQSLTDTGAETEVEASAPPESALAASTPQPRRARRAPRADRALAMAAAASGSFAADDDEPSPPPAPLDADRPLSLRDPGPEPTLDEADFPAPPSSGFQPIELGVPRTPPRARGRLLAGAALGIVFGIAVGWLGGWLARDGMARPSGPAAAPVQVAAVAPAPAPSPAPVAVQPAPETALGPAEAQATPDAAAAPASPPPKAPDAAAAAPAPDGTAMELPASGTEEAEADAAKAAKAEKTAERARARAARAQAAAEAPSAVAPPAVAKGCATQPTPADRTICGDAKLRRLQADLRRAYDEALDAHEDRALLREHQLAWRDTRSAVADPERLARLYADRIRKLKAAAAEARRER